MNKNIKKIILLCGLFCYQTAFSQDMKPQNWNFATGYSENDFKTKNIHLFVKEINEKSNGKIKISLHSNASLYKTPEIFRAVRSGQVELGELLIANLGNEEPLLRIDNLPFLVSNYQEAEKLWLATQEQVKTILDKKGVVFLFTVPWPTQNFYTKTPIDNIKFFEGKKLRAYNALTSRLATALKASPTTIQTPEIPQAFATGNIDAMVTSSTTGVDSQAWDFVKYFTVVNAWIPKNMVFINKKVWVKLPKDEQDIILTAAKNAQTRGWEMSKKDDEESKKELVKNGIIVNEPSKEMQAQFKQIGTELLDEWLKEVGKDGEKIVDNYKK